MRALYYYTDVVDGVDVTGSEHPTQADLAQIIEKSALRVTNLSLLYHAECA